jgi:chemotaxis protein MotB
MAAKVEDKKAGPPAYMVSFGDMMTLILTFFILLVSMAKKQDPGLVADGVGSFIVALETHGLNGVLSGAEKQAIFDKTRRKFGLPTKAEELAAADFDDTSALELLRTKAAEGLEPHEELNQPNLARFDPGSSELTYSARRFLDRMITTIRPGKNQLLVLKGHAADSAGMNPAADRQLASKRARAVRKYLIENHNFVDERVEARGWMVEIAGPDTLCLLAMAALL